MNYPNVEIQIRRLEITVLVFRVLVAIWTGFSVLTFFALGLFGTLATSRPLFIFGAALEVGFFVILCWPVRPYVRDRLPRILKVLQWQVGVGVLLAFTLGFVVSEDKREGFVLLGAYMAISALPLVVVSLLDLALRPRYEQLDQTTAAGKLDALRAALDRNARRSTIGAAASLVQAVASVYGARRR